MAMEGGKAPPPPPRADERDAFNLAYIAHFLLGAGNLLPWNALVTAVDYFGHLYPSKHIDKVFSVAYMTSSLPILVLIITCNNYIPSFRCRMNFGFSIFALSLLTLPLLDWTHPHAAYTLTVFAVVFCGLADGLIAGSLIGCAGLLPKRYMQAVFAGTASSGVLVSILRIITKASLPQTPQGLQTSAHLYFMVSTLIMLGCIVSCNILERLPVIQHYRYNKLPNIFHHPTTGGHNNFLEVVKKIRWSALGIMVIYIVTLSIFPGYISENVKSQFLHDWYPIFLITIYNVMDLIGKSLTAVYAPNTSGKALWACAARLLFFPLFTACLHGPRWLRTEVPVVLLTAALGLTNGYITSNLMILAPKSVPVSEAETAGIIMVFFLGLGLVGGSVLGWLWVI